MSEARSVPGRLTVALLTALVLFGAACGGSGGPGVDLAGKIDDRLGMLGGENKPDPFASRTPAQVQPQSVATDLTPAAPPVTGAVSQDQVFWYDCSLTANQSTYVVTLQPLGSTQDSDLYVFKPVSGGMLRIGTSHRGHAGDSLATGDWLALTATLAGRYQFAVYGYSPTAPTLDQYRVEVDPATLVPTSGTTFATNVPATDSRWFRFSATEGAQYTVALTSTSGDADLFVYQATSDKLVGKSRNSTGADTLSFTAAATGQDFVRVYGVAAANFTLAVTQTAAPNPPTLEGVQLFPADNPWNTDISAYPVHANSAAYIASIGASGHLHPDFGTSWNGAPIGFPYVVVSGTQPKVAVSFDYANQSDPGPYPIPPDVPIEGGSSSTGDRHVLIVDKDNKLLYELYYAWPQVDGSWHAGSGAKFDLTSNALRPEYWTSADAAGLPILPGLVRYDEVMAGEIRHALRFTVANTQHAYIHPATHWASSATDAALPPMGLRLRLKASYDISGFPAHVQVILTALKKYGMLVADNGSNWFISGTHDDRWNDDELGAIKTVPGSAFEAVETGPLVTS